MSLQVSSFDIFDTLLIRRWARPVDLFVELGERLLRAGQTNIPPLQWGQHRQKAEALARECSQSEEVTLEEIYARLAERLGMDNLQVEVAMEMEVVLEKEALVIVPETLKRLQVSREQGHKILFLSDMYLPNAVVKEILTEHGLLEEYDEIYLSSEKMMTKHQGTLFQYVLANEKVDPGQIKHIGDNYYADVAIPRRLGFNAEHFSASGLNPMEEYICNSEQYLPLKLRSLVAGASRLARLGRSITTPKEQVITEVSTAVIGPVLFGFVYWCLMKARQFGLKRLYFVSRDGQILFRIAENLIRLWRIDLECRYLYGSRQAWHLPALTELGEEEFSWVFAETNFVSVRSVFYRVGCHPEDFCGVLEENGFPGVDWDRQLSPQSLARLRKLFASKLVEEKILAKAQGLRENLKQYLHQEGLDDGLSFAIVDVGWNGRLQHSLHKLREIFGMNNPANFHGLYFGLERRSPSVDYGLMHAYFADETKPDNLELLQGHVPVLEQFFAADHGGVDGYEMEGEIVSPLLRSARNGVSLEWGLEWQQDSVVACAQRLGEAFSPENSSPEDFLPLSKIVLESFLVQPGGEISEVFGAQLISEDQAEDRYYELAPPFSLQSALHYGFSGRLQHNNQWLEASIQRSRPIPRWLVSTFNYPVCKRGQDIRIRLASWMKARTH